MLPHNQWSMNVRALATTLALFIVSVESKLYLVSTKNDSSVAEKGTIKALDTPTYISQSNSLHFQAIGKM